MRCTGVELERLDARLASLAREEAALRLRLGQALEVLGRGGVFDLGFSSLAAYAVERCERSARWAESARCVTRRVEKLPQLRRAMATGAVSWSMGELLARVAQPDDEGRWLEMARQRTVRQMRAHVAKAVAEAGTDAQSSVDSASDESCTAEDETCTLSCTVDQEEAWLFEATQSLLQQLGVHGADARIEAMLAEGQDTLLSLVPRGAFDPECGHGSDSAQRRWVAQLARWRSEAEALCERSLFRPPLAWPGPGEDAAGVAGMAAIAAAGGLSSLEHATCGELDRHVRVLSEALARHERDLSLMVLRFHRADGWRRLGYATETQYARERLGMSQSSILARRRLALRLEKLPGVTAALGAGQIGVEAALALVRVATADTEAEWVERARRRTIKHLREEVAAAQTAVRWSGERCCPPPVDAEMAAFQALERAVVSGRVARLLSADARAEAEPNAGRSRDVGASLSEPATEQRRAWLAMLGSLASWLDTAFQTSAAGTTTTRAGARSSAGRVTLRLRMARSTYAWWRGLEAQARRWLGCGMSWLRFSCLSVWQAWRHVRGADVAYGHIYVRDRYRCASPVCNRRDVTPHHLRFRSAGGSDDDDNITSPCTWCHLDGVHGGRIRARGTARLIHWELGPMGSPCLVVHGREKQAGGVRSSAPP